MIWSKRGLTSTVEDIVGSVCVMVTKKYGQVYSCEVYRHPDRRRRNSEVYIVGIASEKFEKCPLFQF